MVKIFLFVALLIPASNYSQTVSSIFNSAFTKFAGDANLKHATISLFVVNNKSGTSVTEVNIQTGLAPASTQKIITAATAYELLKKDFSYKTTLSYTGNINNGVLDGDIIISGTGDPTLGSWRYSGTTEEKIIAEFLEAITQKGIKKINGNVIADESSWQGEATPDGWIWQDIANYYGAGARAINWRENQFDLLLASGKNIGGKVSIAGTVPAYVTGLHLRSMAVSAALGSGDNTYIYFPLNDMYGAVRGTIPVNESRFKISGAMPQPAKQLAITLEATLKNEPIEKINEAYLAEIKTTKSSTVFYTHTSPSLDSISYWFLKKSINLYGEALLKTLGKTLAGSGSTDSGVNVLQSFWKKQNIEPYAINMMDGSGLSPGNRITTSSLVQVLLYAEKQSWFTDYFNGFPEINGIRMKSGSINGVISYTGFIKSKKGEEYAFAFIVNNYDGSGNALRQKMWKLLDLLK